MSFEKELGLFGPQLQRDDALEQAPNGDDALNITITRRADRAAALSESTNADRPVARYKAAAESGPMRNVGVFANWDEETLRLA